MCNERQEMDDYEAVLRSVELGYSEPNFERDPLSFELLSTIRYDPSLTPSPPHLATQITPSNFYLLDLHLLRLQYTLGYFAQHYEKTNTFELPRDLIVQKLVEAISNSGKSTLSPYKIRLLVKLDGSVSVEVHDTPPIDNLEALDVEPTFDLYTAKMPTPISPFTSFKTTWRKHYTDARAQTLPGAKPGREEALLYNFQGVLTEGTITNVAVRHGDRWITPMLSSGCLCGVMRHRLLQKGVIEELTISIHLISPGSEVLVFNAIMGVAKGILVK